MAIIYSYPYDTNIQDNDAWIGTNDGVGRKTKQFTVGAVANYLNIAGKVSIGGQMSYKLTSLPPGLGEMKVIGGGDGTDFVDIEFLNISTNDLSGAQVIEFLDYLVSTGLLISHQNNPSTFGHYTVVAYSPTVDPSVYKLELSILGGNGKVFLNNYYDLSPLNLAGGTGSGVTTVDTSEGSFITLTPTTPTAGNVLITADLSATGTPDNTTYLRGDNTWASIPPGLAGSGTTNYVAKWSAADALTNSVIYDNGTNVGIGTTSPSQKLHVDGSARVTGAYYDSGNTPGTANQLLASTATGTAWIDPSTIVAEAATLVVIACKNTSGAAIAQGTPVYQTGTVGATATIEIAPADALISANKLPAIGLLQTALNNNGFGFVVITGELTNFTTSPIDGVVPTTGDKVFVKSGGGLTLTKPTGEGNGVQNMGLVGKVSGGNSGSITVSSIMRTNDVPNLPLGRLFVGTNTNTSLTSDVVYIDDANSNVGIGTASPSEKLEISTGGGVFEPAVIALTSNNDGAGAAGSYIYFKDNTSVKWQIGKNVAQDFIIYDNTANGNKFRILDNGDILLGEVGGNVGIATTSPNYKLDVAGSVRIEEASALNFGGTAVASSTWQLQTANTDADFQIGETNTGPRMYFEAGGDVGIGNTAPAQKLHVSGNIRVGTTADNVFSNKFTALGNVDVELSSNAGHNLLLNSTSGDNVGVGTPTPQAKLDVAGGIKMSDDASAAASTNVGTLRYRADANNSYVDMCMQTGASTYVWVNIVQNNW